MIPHHPHLRRGFAQPKPLRKDATANIKAWQVGHNSLFVVMRTYHEGFPKFHTVQVMYFRRPRSCPQVLARWSSPHQDNFPEYIQETFKHFNSTNYPWPELGLPAILTLEQFLKVQGRWMQPLRKKEGKRVTKTPYWKVKQVVVPRNDSVNLSALYPGCEIVKAELIRVDLSDDIIETRPQLLELNGKSAKLYRNQGMEFYATINRTAKRYRQALGQWRISMSSEDREIKSFTVRVTIKKEASDGNV